MNPRAQPSTDASVRTFVSQHAQRCRQRVRAAMLTSDKAASGIAVSRDRLTPRERKSFDFWCNAGMSRLDAMRLVCDPSLQRGILP